MPPKHTKKKKKSKKGKKEEKAPHGRTYEIRKQRVSTKKRTGGYVDMPDPSIMGKPISVAELNAKIDELYGFEHANKNDMTMLPHNKDHVVAKLKEWVRAEESKRKLDAVKEKAEKGARELHLRGMRDLSEVDEYLRSAEGSHYVEERAKKVEEHNSKIAAIRGKEVAKAKAQADKQAEREKRKAEQLAKREEIRTARKNARESAARAEQEEKDAQMKLSTKAYEQQRRREAAKAEADKAREERKAQQLAQQKEKHEAREKARLEKEEAERKEKEERDAQMKQDTVAFRKKREQQDREEEVERNKKEKQKAKEEKERAKPVPMEEDVAQAPEDPHGEKRKRNKKAAQRPKEETKRARKDDGPEPPPPPAAAPVEAPKPPDEPMHDIFARTDGRSVVSGRKQRQGLPEAPQAAPPQAPPAEAPQQNGVVSRPPTDYRVVDNKRQKLRESTNTQIVSRPGDEVVPNTPSLSFVPSASAGAKRNADDEGSAPSGTKTINIKVTAPEGSSVSVNQ